MPIYLVWDESGSEDAAHSYSDSSAADAAATFADDDVDGNIDGVYEHGHTVYVKDEAGLVLAFEVTVEYTPTFHVTKPARLITKSDTSDVVAKPDDKAPMVGERDLEESSS